MTANQIAYWNYVETNRHNLAIEKETYRSNMSRERETRRSNQAQEALGSERNAIESEKTQVQREANVINANRNAETMRHNYATEAATTRSLDLDQQRVALGYSQVEASKLGAQLSYAGTLANVGLGYSNLAETSRANVARETLNTQVESSKALLNSRRLELDKSKQAFEETKWSTGGMTQSQASAYASIQSGRLSAAKTANIPYENTIQGVNSASNVIGAAGRVASSLLLKRRVK